VPAESSLRYRTTDEGTNENQEKFEDDGAAAGKKAVLQRKGLDGRLNLHPSGRRLGGGHRDFAGGLKRSAVLLGSSPFQGLIVGTHNQRQSQKNDNDCDGRARHRGDTIPLSQCHTRRLSYLHHADQLH